MGIKFYERYQPESQLKIIEDALLSGNLSSNGKYTGFLSDFFYRSLNIRNILFTTSATTALELAVQMLKLESGDEVIIPSYNFPSAANAVMKSGGSPVLCDVERRTKNIDIEDAAARITKCTKAIIPTHYAGISCDMDKLSALAKEYHIMIIEDAAQAVYSLYKQSYLGTIGDFGAFSFHHTKNFCCGEGGAFIAKDSSFVEAAEIIMDNGTNKAEFLRNQVQNYTWQIPGSNYVLNEAGAALLYAQMTESNEILTRRKSIAETYNSILEQASQQLDEKVSMMEIPAYAKPNYHIYYINCENHKSREKLRDFLLQDGIDVRTHFIPLHHSAFGNQLGYKDLDLPNSLNISKTILRLPIHTEMTTQDAVFVAEQLIKRVRQL